MTLRVRLLLTILITAIPVTPGLFWLAARQERRSVEASVRDHAWFAVAQAGALVAAVLIAFFPIVRRIRSLTAAVKRSAASRYALPVPPHGNDEIGGLARAFEEAGVEVRTHLTRLEKREETLRAFIANTTHDVMLPVTVLQGHLAELRRSAHAGEKTDPRVVASCQRETDYLTSILQNLAAVAKLEGADYDARNDRVTLNHLVDRVVARYRSIAKVETVGLDFSIPAESLEVLGDVTLLEQALGNVIHNAVRYNRPHGHVAVLLEAVDGGRRFSLRVIDDGPGIPQADLARLTERRFRGDAARTRNPAGLGLGLHVVREVARRHGFSLSITRSGYGGLEVALSGIVAAPAPAVPTGIGA